MFMTFDNHEFRVPAALAGDGARFWRMLFTVVETAWFRMRVSWRDPSGELIGQTILCWADRDVIEALRLPEFVRLEALTCVLPVWAEHCEPYLRINEIWASVSDSADPDIVFVDDHGVRRSGLGCEPTNRSLDDMLLIAGVPTRGGLELHQGGGFA